MRNQDADSQRSPGGWKTRMYGGLLSAFLMLAILGAGGALLYALENPPGAGAFTEFYALGVDGGAEGYTREVVIGEQYATTLGIVNREYEQMTYGVVVTMGETVVREIGPIELECGQKWEDNVQFVPPSLGTNQEVSFRLFKICRVGEDAGKTTLLTRWVGREELGIAVRNQGDSEADYSLAVSIVDGSGEGEVIGTYFGEVGLAAGEEWKQTIEYSFREAGSRLDLRLFKNGLLIYEERVAGAYPELTLLVDVAGTEP